MVKLEKNRNMNGRLEKRDKIVRQEGSIEIFKTKKKSRKQSLEKGKNNNMDEHEQQREKKTVSFTALL